MSPSAIRRRPGCRLACAAVVGILLVPILWPELISTQKSQLSRSTGSLLLFVAHPDDETLFFSPALSVLAEGRPPYLLYATDGNAWGKGEARQAELRRAVARLQVPESHLAIASSDTLLDSKNTSWSPDEAADLVAAQVEQHSISTILTFDEDGVYRHPNHQDCYHGVQRYLEQCAAGERGERGCPQALKLVTARKVYKSLSLLGVLPAALEARLRGQVVVANHYLWRSVAAFAAHRSQARWWPHLLTSPYTLLNVLEPFGPEPAGAEGQGRPHSERRRRGHKRLSSHRRVLRHKLESAAAALDAPHLRGGEAAHAVH